MLCGRSNGLHLLLLTCALLLAGFVDPYCTLDVGSTRRVRTRFIKNSPREATWNERYWVYVCDEADELSFEVKEGQLTGARVFDSQKSPKSTCWDVKLTA